MSEKTVAIHQPNFMPWLGFFDKMRMVDTFVLFDDVQVPTGKSFASRALIKTNTGELWITVPTLSDDKPDFRNTRILQSNWQTKTLKTIQLAYQKAPFFKKYFEEFSQVYMTPANILLDYNYQLLLFFKKHLGINAELIFSSELGGEELTGAEKIFHILEATAATTYVSGKGSGSKRYINEQDFIDRNLKLVWQEFKSPVYPQLHGEFIDKLSALDYLFNCGGEAFANN